MGVDNLVQSYFAMSKSIDKQPLLNKSEDGKFKLYKTRWLVMICAAIAQLSIGMTWMTFTNVAYDTAKFYDITIEAVNWLTLCGTVVSIVFGPAATWALQTYGLRFATLFGVWTMAIGCVIRILSALPTLEHVPQEVLLFFGQVVWSFGGAITGLCPTVVANSWFGDSERALVNTLITIAQPLGIVFAGIIPPCFVVDGNLQTLSMLLYMSIPTFIGCILASFVMRRGKPKTPPSAGENGKKEEFFKGITHLFRNKDFIILWICTSGSIVSYTVVHLFLEQILCPFGYPMDITGYSFAVLTCSGILGAIATGVYCDKTKQFSSTLKTLYVTVALGKITLCIIPFHFNLQYYILIFLGLVGLFSFSLVPIGMELAAECAYPIEVATLSGVILWTANIQSVIVNNIFEAFGTEINQNSTDYNIMCSDNSMQLQTSQLNTTTEVPSNSSPIYDLRVSWYIVTGYFCTLTLLMLACFKPSYKRLHAKPESNNKKDYIEITGVKESETG